MDQRSDLAKVPEEQRPPAQDSNAGAPLPRFDFDPAPRGDSCERCGAGRDADLRFVILRGRTRYVGRTLCDMCSEEVLESLLEASPERASA